jgi:hypothetical protein
LLEFSPYITIVLTCFLLTRFSYIQIKGTDRI